jgi:sulfate permease, SulP family
VPVAALSTVVVVAVVSIVNVNEPVHLFKLKLWGDLAMLVASFVATLFLGPDNAIIIALAFSIVMALFKTTRPKMPSRHSISLSRDATYLEGILVVRFDADLFFANAAFLKERTAELMRESEDDRLKIVALDLTSGGGGGCSFYFYFIYFF